MNDLSKEALARYKAIAEAATPGPWKQVGPEVHDGHHSMFAKMYGYALNQQLSKNAAYIAAFDPPTCLALLARIEALEAALGWKSIDRKQYPKNYEIMKHSQGFMEELVTMQRECISELERRLGVARDSLCNADRYFDAKRGKNACDVVMSEKAAAFSVDKALAQLDAPMGEGK